MRYTHYIQQRDRELKKMAAMRAHNIGFYKPSHWHAWCQVICFCWWGSSLLDVHFKLSIITLRTKPNKGRQWNVKTRLEQLFVIVAVIKCKNILEQQRVCLLSVQALFSRRVDYSVLTGTHTIYGLAIMVVDVVVGFILLVLSQDILAGHSRDDRQMSWGSLGNGRITSVQ